MSPSPNKRGGFLAVSRHRRIEELGNHWCKQVGAGSDAMKGRRPADMRGGRKYRKLRSRKARQVAICLATAEQTKELHDVRQAYAVAISNHNQDGRRER